MDLEGTRLANAPTLRILLIIDRTLAHPPPTTAPLTYLLSRDLFLPPLLEHFALSLHLFLHPLPSTYTLERTLCLLVSPRHWVLDIPSSVCLLTLLPSTSDILILLPPTCISRVDLFASMSLLLHPALHNHLVLPCMDIKFPCSLLPPPLKMLLGPHPLINRLLLRSSALAQIDVMKSLTPLSSPDETKILVSTHFRAHVLLNKFPMSLSAKLS